MPKSRLGELIDIDPDTQKPTRWVLTFHHYDLQLVDEEALPLSWATLTSSKYPVPKDPFPYQYLGTRQPRAARCAPMPVACHAMTWRDALMHVPEYIL
eukprot:SAG31_NODE_2485_length_5624_cov_2.110206_2_plen_98_part_00